MKASEIKTMLEGVRDGDLDVDAAAERLARASYADLGFAKVDLDRRNRHGQAEVVYCEGKRPEQVAAIVGTLVEAGETLLGTRASREIYEACLDVAPDLEYHDIARCFHRAHARDRLEPALGTVAVVSAGTSDMPVAEEAALTAEVFGNPVERIYDAGVAGLHRLLGESQKLRDARVVVVVAGMEGALPSVVGGLVRCPVLAVPTSVGYGASFGGVAALLGMLNSCASNVTVVNIDNGFGAAYVANLINRGQRATDETPA